MYSTKRNRQAIGSSSPETSAEKRQRLEADSVNEGAPQSSGEAPMDLDTSSDSDPEEDSEHKTLNQPQRPFPINNTTTPSSFPEYEEYKDYEHDEEYGRDEEYKHHEESKTYQDYEDDGEWNDEEGMLSWGQNHNKFHAEPALTSQAENEHEPETFHVDPRLPLWQEEDRDFRGNIIGEYSVLAKSEAIIASHGPLVVNGVPQLSLFCDGSIVHPPSRGWNPGGYRVAFRDPFLGTTPFVSQVNPMKFATAPRVQEHTQVEAIEGLQALGAQVLSEDTGPESPVQVANWTTLAYASKTPSIGHIELAAISQALEVAIKLQKEHEPETMKISIFTDSKTAIERLEFGILPLDSDEESRFRWSTNPLVRTMVWQSHYLYDRGCTIEIHWNRRCCALGPALADAVASSWKSWERERFCQRDVPAEKKDGILEKLHKWTNDVINWVPEEEVEVEE
ncbi:hypothetical protein B0T20DRAFT_358005 [Sordaria brevicollis]|uniref:RNase H type-1 domain-containing protein n=1 Tax=Sordaria brevicollis TaxID=83679 RepID=A0AAE0UA97_SORBR|nr:hypothetical protein B0T20DRAFT_358005 [Sordaria brevicollis]